MRQQYGSWKGHWGTGAEWVPGEACHRGLHQGRPRWAVVRVPQALQAGSLAFISRKLEDAGGF